MRIIKLETVGGFVKEHRSGEDRTKMSSEQAERLHSTADSALDFMMGGEQSNGLVA